MGSFQPILAKAFVERRVLSNSLETENQAGGCRTCLSVTANGAKKVNTINLTLQLTNPSVSVKVVLSQTKMKLIHVLNPPIVDALDFHHGREIVILVPLVVLPSTKIPV